MMYPSTSDCAVLELFKHAYICCNVQNNKTANKLVWFSQYLLSII
jgi:hypothetical protein